MEKKETKDFDCSFYYALRVMRYAQENEPIKVLRFLLFYEIKDSD